MYLLILSLSSKEFAVGDWVYLKLQPFKQQSIPNSVFHKLAARFYGPYRIVERVGKVEYKLELPSQACIHNVFHISLLKRHHGDCLVSTTLPSFDSNNQLELKTIDILARRIKKKGNRLVTKVLIHWQHTTPEEATWHEVHKLKQQFPQVDWDFLLTRLVDERALGARLLDGGEIVILSL